MLYSIRARRSLLGIEIILGVREQKGIKIEVKVVGDLVNAMVRSWPEGIVGRESVVLNSKVRRLSIFQRYCASHSM